MEPLQPCYRELEKFIEPGTEVNKKDLLSLVSYRVSYYLMTTCKTPGVLQDRQGCKGWILCLVKRSETLRNLSNFLKSF
jgi:hypothetical protein